MRLFGVDEINEMHPNLNSQLNTVKTGESHKHTGTSQKITDNENPKFSVS